MCLAQGPQRSDAGEARTRYPSVSSQALYHWATALPMKFLWNIYNGYQVIERTRFCERWMDRRTQRETRNVSMGHGCPRYCQICINRALSLTKGHNSNNNWWILSVIELDLYFMITYLCMKYESITPTYSKDIARKPFFIWRSRAITLIIIGWFYP